MFLKQNVLHLKNVYLKKSLFILSSLIYIVLCSFGVTYLSCMYSLNRIVDAKGLNDAYGN